MGCGSAAEGLGTQDPDPARREAGRGGEPERGRAGRARKAWPDRTLTARSALRAGRDTTPRWTPRTRTAGAEHKGEGRGTPDAKDGSWARGLSTSTGEGSR